MSEINQTNNFLSESFRYVNSYLEIQENKEKLIPKIIKSKKINSILDVGCGNGSFLNFWSKKFNSKVNIGIEPSDKSIKILKKKWKGTSLKFESSYAHQLKFDSNKFDLVTCWSVLHWVGRNEYLQSIGELVRVSKKYLCIMDFVASQNYKVPYKHKKNMFTYKQDFEPILSATGIMKPIATLRWWVNPKNNKLVFLKEKDLKIFNNIKSYHSRKMILYEKNFNLMQVKTEKNFIKKIT